MLKTLMIFVGAILALPLFENTSFGEIPAFSLSQNELQALQYKNNQPPITLEQLDYWDQIVNELTTKSPLKDGDINRLTAYLYNAQRAFGEASNALTGSYSGNIDPISLHVLQLFYPSYQDKRLQGNASDSFSKELTALLIKKIDARFQEEESQIHPFPIKEGKDLWHGTPPYMGLNIPSMKLWILKQANEFKAPPPPPPEAPFWKDQLAQVKQSMGEATKQQKERILYWAGMSGPGSGEWDTIASAYMSKYNTPISKRLEVRALLAAVLLDARIAIWDSKYTYMVKRPFMLDPQLKPYIETPNHPSYPAGHSGTSAAAAVVLSYYFPENQKEWERLAEECGESRIWAGIHFPIDISASKEMGAKIGRAALLKVKKD